MALADDLHPYQYLWDGSQPGWGLTHINSQHTGLALQFSVPGGSAQERLSARKTIEEFKPLSIQQVTTRLQDARFSLWANLRPGRRAALPPKRASKA